MKLNLLTALENKGIMFKTKYGNGYFQNKYPVRMTRVVELWTNHPRYSNLFLEIIWSDCSGFKMRVGKIKLIVLIYSLIQ